MPIEKRQGETRDEFVSRCVKKEMDGGMPQDQALAVCLTYADENFKGLTKSVSDNTWSTEAPINVNLESYTDYPEAAKTNAQIALDWAEENGWGDCGTAVGKQRANQLAKGEPISRDTIARMAAFERHRQNSQKDLGDGCGRLMWQAWGGDEGIAWAQRKLEQIDSQNLAALKISFDYDQTLSTSRGMALARKLKSEGNTIYIISARREAVGMFQRADELGIPHSRVYATGSNKAKVEKIKELDIDKHYDNNLDVISNLPRQIGDKFSKIRKVIFNEDFDEEVVREYKQMGFKVYIRSSRKIKKKDRKVWNKLKSAGLSEDDLVFGELKDLDKRHNFDLHMTGDDPILEALMLRGNDIKMSNVLKSYPVNSIEEAERLELEVLNSLDLKFVTVKVLYTYGEIPGIPDAKSGSRPFCQKMMANQSRAYSLDEIKQLPNEHLKKMFKKYGLEPDVFQYRGGFYRLPGTLNTTPWCRHQWNAKVVVE